MNVQMPEMVGFESNTPHSQLGFQGPHKIAMTANTLNGDKKPVQDMGTDDCVSKPIRMEELQKALGKMRRNKGMQWLIKAVPVTIDVISP